MNPRAAVVLAAGKGKRMKSELPKVLHEIDGRPLIRYAVDTLAGLNFERVIVVIGIGGEEVQEALSGLPVEFVWQREQLGTGHAVMMTREALADFNGTVLVALGDVPFLTAGSIARLIETHEATSASATCLSAVVDDPSGYGRVVRAGEGDLMQGIVEDKEATDSQRTISEINTGTICFDKGALFGCLDELGNDNSQREYYLTDTIKILHDKGLKVAAVVAQVPDEWRGVNSAEQLNFLAKRFGRK